ncbi:E3 ubiquitin-protein ligase rnf168 [Eumeta japonica]|uniref:RING-type E3 ubiquitin transferase n=1 Tax=Eumeta variegata TaxID=151549 RepID=A0A4C1UAH8_EUMVA|nr:E3 ubiquitin-protein ligase rnf168 [Eumeta japonica]
MAAKSKKRSLGVENKLLNVENNALCCPLCRLRIGSWLRTSRKNKKLINVSLWNFLKDKFHKEVHTKLKGEDLALPEEKIVIRLSAPGEIRLEYEAELQRLRTERLKLEEKHFHDTETLVKKLQEEDLEAHKHYLERIEVDERLAKALQKRNIINGSNNIKIGTTGGTHKSCLKPTKIDSYLYKTNDQPITTKKQLLLSDKGIESTTPKIHAKKALNINGNKYSPEIVPSYGTFVKNLIDKKIRSVASLWNKDNGSQSTQKAVPMSNNKNQNISKCSVKQNSKQFQSLPVSLPYIGILNKKIPVVQSTETDSVDSMHQELCYFKPIEGTTPTSYKPSSGLPLRVPSKLAEQHLHPLTPKEEPSRVQYLESLCQLRNLSISNNLPSAFVLALKILQVKKETNALQETPTKADKNTKNKVIKTVLKSSYDGNKLTTRKCATSNRNKNNTSIDGITKLETENTLRRTRSIGSLPKINEITPKKAKVRDRKAISERKPYLRSDSKKVDCIRKLLNSPTPEPIKIDHHKVNLVMKNLSSPCCNVKKILEEQLQIEKMIEQEKKDLELARKMQAEWNGECPVRRVTRKRNLTAAYTLRPAKKLKAQ